MRPRREGESGNAASFWRDLGGQGSPPAAEEPGARRPCSGPRAPAPPSPLRRGPLCRWPEPPHLHPGRQASGAVSSALSTRPGGRASAAPRRPAKAAPAAGGGTRPALNRAQPPDQRPAVTLGRRAGSLSLGSHPFLQSFLESTARVSSDTAQRAVLRASRSYSRPPKSGICG